MLYQVILTIVSVDKTSTTTTTSNVHSTGQHFIAMLFVTLHAVQKIKKKISPEWMLQPLIIINNQ